MGFIFRTEPKFDKSFEKLTKKDNALKERAFRKIDEICVGRALAIFPAFCADARRIPATVSLALAGSLSTVSEIGHKPPKEAIISQNHLEKLFFHNLYKCCSPFSPSWLGAKTNSKLP